MLIFVAENGQYIQLPCFVKQEAECESKLDEWIYNIKNMGATQTVAFKDNDAIFNYLDSVSSVAALSHKERETYEAALRYSRDYHAILATAREKGMEKGRKEGLKEGIAKGEFEMLRRNVLSMRSKGLSDESIADILDQPLASISSIS